MDNLSQQFDEIEALSSIYDQDWKIENEDGTSYSIQVTPDVKLFITFIPEYPSEKPPKYEMTAPALTVEQKRQIEEEFKQIYKYVFFCLCSVQILCMVAFSENCGTPVLFQWIERLKELLECWRETIQKTTHLNNLIVRDIESPLSLSCELDVTHGPLIQDRKSVFQGHACKVNSQQDVK